MPQRYTSLVLRILVGILFVMSGLFKLASLGVGFSATIVKLGLPFPMFWAWLVLLCEIVFGILVLFGWKLKYTIWPLIAILVVATAGVTIPNALKNVSSVGGWGSLLFHLITIVVLIDLAYKK